MKVKEIHVIVYSTCTKYMLGSYFSQVRNKHGSRVTSYIYHVPVHNTINIYLTVP